MRKLNLVAMLVTCSLILTSCLEDSKDTIILPEIIVVEDVPDDIIPASIRSEFESHMSIYEGKLPPIIQGEYVMSEMVLSYNSVGDFEIGHVFSDCYMAFLNQVGGSCQYAEKQASSTSYAEKVYITGNNNDFTAYFVAHHQRSDGYTWSTMSTLVSGTISSAGIKNCKYAFIMLEKNDPDDKLMPVNGYRVFYDNTNLASRQSWYEESQKAPTRMQQSENKGIQDMLEKNMLNVENVSERSIEK